jgi:hypothetical protein
MHAEPVDKRSVVLSKVRWEDNIKMDLWETDCEDGRLIEMAGDRVIWRYFDIIRFLFSVFGFCFQGGGLS